MASSISLPRVESGNPLLKGLRIVPGVLLLAGIGYAGKILEHSVNAYAKGHHWTFPNIEYVLWAILIGLVISNTLVLRKYSIRARNQWIIRTTVHTFLRDRCPRGSDRTRCSQANGRDGPDKGRTQKVLLRVRGFRCMRTEPAVRRVRQRTA